MPIATLGTRRLYDALGVARPTVEEIHQQINLAIGKTVTLYIGPNPPLGIMTLEGDQYVIPGAKCSMLRTDNTYKAPCFMEISVSFQRDITISEMELLKNGDQTIRQNLLQEADKDLEQKEYLLDLVGGIIGLQGHRQFLLKPLIQNSFLTGDFESASSFIGPPVEVLERLEINSNTGAYIRQVLESIVATPEKSLRKGGLILHWLLKAWRERDPTSKFMYLFIPLEAVLPSNSELAVDAKKDLESLEFLVKSSDSPNKQALLNFLERTKTKFSPTLNSRFEDFARSSEIPGWELDVEAFKKYNRMRNLLLHSANRNVRSHIDIEKNTRTLEDLVERYVLKALLGRTDVYQNRHRPEREFGSARED